MPAVAGKCLVDPFPNAPSANFLFLSKLHKISARVPGELRFMLFCTLENIKIVKENHASPVIGAETHQREQARPFQDREVYNRFLVSPPGG